MSDRSEAIDGLHQELLWCPDPKIASLINNAISIFQDEDDTADRLSTLEESNRQLTDVALRFSVTSHQQSDELERLRSTLAESMEVNARLSREIARLKRKLKPPAKVVIKSIPISRVEKCSEVLL